MAKTRWCLAVIMSGGALLVLLVLGIAACGGTSSPIVPSQSQTSLTPPTITPTPTPIPTPTPTPTPPPKTLVTFLIDCSTSVANNAQAKTILWRYLPDFWFSLAKAVSMQLSPDLYFSVILFPSPEVVLTPTRVLDLAKLPAIEERKSSNNEYDKALEMAERVGEGEGFAKRVVVLLSDCTWNRDDQHKVGDQLGLLGRHKVKVYVVVVPEKDRTESQWWEPRVDRMVSVSVDRSWLSDLTKITEEFLGPLPQKRELTATGECVRGWISDTTTLDTVLPGDFVSVTARVISLWPMTVSLRTTPHGADFPLERDRQWPWANLYSRVRDDFHKENCQPYTKLTLSVNQCENCPNSLGFYQLEFFRPAFSPDWNPVESINNEATKITLTLKGLDSLEWQQCYTATLSVSEGKSGGDGKFDGDPLTTVLTWQPEQRPELGPRTCMGTIQLWARGASEAVFTLPTTLTVKYRPELLTVTHMGTHREEDTTNAELSPSDTYLIPASFAPAFAKPEVYLTTEKGRREIEEVNMEDNLQGERGRCADIDLWCPLPTPPTPIQIGSEERYVCPLEEGERALCNDHVATWWRVGDHYVVKLFKFVSHEKHCGYDRVLFRWAPSAEIVETAFECFLPRHKGEKKECKWIETVP